MRGAKLDIKNRNNLTPSECMVVKNPETKTIVQLSTILHQMMAEAKISPNSVGEKIVSNDITKAKESNPIQCVNAIDDELEPSEYIYVSKNCVTNSVPIDRNISKLQVTST